MAVAQRYTDDASSMLSTSPPLALAADVRHLLDSFLTEKASREQEMQALAQRAASNAQGQEADPPAAISPADFIRLFTEDWQLSQFWYTPEFAGDLARHVIGLARPSSQIAFLCCPTGYCATRWLLEQRDATAAERIRLRLLECDSRFAAFSGSDFVKYDLEDPLDVPSDMLGSVDIAIVDPPFLTRTTNEKLATSLRSLLKPDGKLLLVTSPAVDGLDETYKSSPLGPLRLSQLEVTHAGLRNDFACMTSWEGGELFGKS